MGRAASIWRRLIFWVLAVVIVLGGNLLCEIVIEDSYDYRALVSSWDDLEDLEKLLHSYKATHGRYPTTDEGLAVLDGYASRFGLEQYHPCLRRGPRKLSYTPWPANEEELRAVLERGINRLGGHESEDPNLLGLEAGVCDTGYVYVLYQKEPLDLTDIPFCYANSKEGEESLMWSDWLGMSSRKVDSGVRISSPGSRAIWGRIAPLTIISAVFFLGIIAFLNWWGFRRVKDKATCVSVRALLMVFLSFFLVFGVMRFVEATSCAATLLPTGEWRKSAGQSYCTFQNAIFSAGLITKQTHDRRIRATLLQEDYWKARERWMNQPEPEPPEPDFYTPVTTSPSEDGNDTGGS